MEDFVKSEKLKEIQQVGCQLLDEFARICRENNLRWFCDSGTLLGAIRHGGFIPWDDDVDVVMPREDYNKLVQLGNSVTKEPFFLQTYKNNDACSVELLLRYIESTKIRETDILELYGPTRSEFLVPKGIAIDIVQLDHVPAGDDDCNKIVQFLFNLHQYFVNNVVHFDQQAGLIFNYDNFNILARDYEKVLTQVDQDCKDSGYIACTNWWINPKYYGCRVHSNCYDEYIEYNFEGCKEKVRVPIGYDEILKAYYGDYMTPKEHASLHDNYAGIFDTRRSYKDYEQLGFNMLIDMLHNNKTL